MAHKMVACVFIPHFLTHVARQGLPTTSSHPLVVATHPSDRAVVTAVCAHAAELGLRPGIFVGDARRRCPSLHVTTVSGDAVTQAIERVERVLYEQADVVEHQALGCWILPLYALGTHFCRATVEAQRLRQAVLARTAFPCTLGLGTWPSIARIAAHVAQQDCQECIVVLPGTERTFLAPLPVDVLPGVGTRSADALRRLGIATVGQLADLPAEGLTDLCGPHGRTLVRQARGLDPGEAPRTDVTIRPTWQTPHEPCADARRLQAQLYTLAEQAGQTLRSQKLAAGSLTVRLTWTDGTTGQRTTRCAPRCDRDRDLAAGSRAALQVLLQGRRLAVLQLTLIAGDLGPLQPDLFAVGDGRMRQLQQALDTVRHRFGAGAIQPGSLLGVATYGTPAAL